MSLLSFLSAAATPATQAVTAAEQGRQERTKADEANTLKMLAQLRQQQQDAEQSSVRQATVRNLNSEADNRGLETFGAPFAGTDEQGAGMFERGNRGTNRRIQGLSPFEKPQEETFSLSHDYTVGGQHVPVQVGNRGSVRNVDGTPLDPKAIKAYEPPKEDNALEAAIDPADPLKKRVIYVPRKQAVGMEKPGAGGAAGGGLQGSSMAASKANLMAAMTGMKEFEADLKTNPDLYTKTHAAMAALASSPTANTATGLTGALNSLGSNTALEKLQKDNPRLWKYITQKKYVAEAILNTHRRPNQTQYEIEQELSGAGPGAGPDQIDMGAERRQRMYDEVFGGDQAPAAPSGGRGGQSTAPTGPKIRTSDAKRPAWAKDISDADWSAYLASKRTP